AQLQAARVSLQHKRDRLTQMKSLSQTGAVSQQELARTEEDYANQQAQLLVKEAESREPELRLQQARRRLERIRASQAQDPLDAKQAPSWAVKLFKEVSVDFGVMAADKLWTHMFHFTNTTGQPLRIASVQTSSSALTATAEKNSLRPDE